MTDAENPAEKARRTLERLYAERMAARTCRHCGGPLPCWSEFGDRAVGRRHTSASLRKLRKESAD